MTCRGGVWHGDWSTSNVSLDDESRDAEGKKKNAMRAINRRDAQRMMQITHDISQKPQSYWPGGVGRDSFGASQGVNVSWPPLRYDHGNLELVDRPIFYIQHRVGHEVLLGRPTNDPFRQPCARNI
jgi:hypothetical protein